MATSIICRVAAARDNNMIKFLAKKISMQKSRIEQQDLKLKRLRQLLATGEKSKKTLATQCLEFQDQVDYNCFQIFCLRSRLWGGGH